MENPALKPIKAIFVDLDGTLLRRDLSISDLDRQAIEEANRMGIEIILASGRPVEAIAQTSSLLGVGRYIIASNGGCIVDLKTNEVISYYPLPMDTVKEISEIAYNHAVTPTIYSATKWFVEQYDSNVDIEVGRASVKPEVVSFNLITDPIIKMLVISNQFPSKEIESKLELVSTAQIEWFYTYPEYLEIMPKTASKGNARDFLLNMLGVPNEQAIAIGDGDNDYALIKGAGIGVAMANSSEKVINAATYITSSNEESGVAAAIFGLVFNEINYYGQLRSASGNK